MGEGEEHYFGSEHSTLGLLQQCLIRNSEQQKQKIVRLGIPSSQGSGRKWPQGICDNPNILRGSNVCESGVPAGR